MATDEVAREVTTSEVRHFQTNGWVALHGFISARYAQELLKAALPLLGEQSDAEYSYFSERHYLARDDGAEPFASLVFSPQMCRAAWRLVGRNVPLRYGSDMLACKHPAGRYGSSSTPWHQDGVFIPHDRSGALSIWVALNDLDPNMGTPRFLSKSHHEGPAGRTADLSEERQDLFERYESSPPLSLEAGDATVHSSYTVHGTAPNISAEARWSYIVTYFPADVRYSGVPYRRYDGLGLEVGETIDHPDYPVVYPDAA